MEREAIDEADHIGAEIFFEALAKFYVGQIGQWDALDMFARDGSLTVSRYWNKVRNLDCWEINADHFNSLAVLGHPSILINCAYEALEKCTKKYDMIVIDNPQGLHTDSNEVVHAEHFDILNRVHRIMKDQCLIVLYVNKEPYNLLDTGNYGRDEYDVYDFDEWMRRRQMFYAGNPRNVTEFQALEAYRIAFACFGYKINHVLLTPCLQGLGLPPSFRLGLELYR